MIISILAYTNRAEKERTFLQNLNLTNFQVIADRHVDVKLIVKIINFQIEK